jgi:hypothetical protein
MRSSRETRSNNSSRSDNALLSWTSVELHRLAKQQQDNLAAVCVCVWVDLALDDCNGGRDACLGVGSLKSLSVWPSLFDIVETRDSWQR